MVIMIRNSLYLILFLFTVFFTSCKEESRVNDVQSIEVLQNETDSIFKEINNEDNFFIENKFKYPKDHLFLNFYSGMTKNEFIIIADSLVDRNILYKKTIQIMMTLKMHIFIMLVKK